MTRGVTFTARPRLAEALEAREDPSEVAQAVGISRSLLDALVAGTALPGGALARRLAEVLETDPEDLFRPHPTMERLNAGRRLTDPVIGGRLSAVVRNRYTIATSQGYPEGVHRSSGRGRITADHGGS